MHKFAYVVDCNDRFLTTYLRIMLGTKQSLRFSHNADGASLKNMVQQITQVDYER